MKKTLALLLLSGMLLNSAAMAEELPPLPKGPLLLTSVTPEQLSPDYWINRLPNPHAVLKTPEELKHFNEEITMMVPDRVDVFKLDSSRPGKPVKDQIELEFGTLRNRIFFGVDDKRIPKSLFDETIKPLIQTDKIPARIQVKWAAATKATSVRALPTDVKMLEEKGDIEFDQLQFTLIKLWTPVAVLHESQDGRWYYVQAPYTRGWVKSRDIAIFSSREELKKYAKPERQGSFLSVTGDSVPVFSDATLQAVSLRPAMGTVLPLAGEIPGAYIVWMPQRGSGGAVRLEKGYVSKKSDVTVGFLPYTQANIIRQAFKLLGARYGWGGTYHGRDCSGFTHDVFLSLGVDMPRNSKEQAFVGTQIGHFQPFLDGESKIAAIRASRPAITLFRMPLHIMLYLGEERGHFYIIHSTWAERISMTSDQKNRINQVVVSDLSLNGNSYLGSLFNRIETVNEVY